MDVDALDAAATTASFDISAIAADVQHPGGSAVPSRAIINRSVEVRDERGTFMESRCEIALENSGEGPGQRGTVVDTGKPNDRWELKSLLYNDGHESGWIATRAPSP